MKCVEELSGRDIFCDLIVDEVDLWDLEERRLEPLTVQIGDFNLHLWLRKANHEENGRELYERFFD